MGKHRLLIGSELHYEDAKAGITLGIPELVYSSAYYSLYALVRYLLEEQGVFVKENSDVQQAGQKYLKFLSLEDWDNYNLIKVNREQADYTARENWQYINSLLSPKDLFSIYCDLYFKLQREV